MLKEGERIQLLEDCTSLTCIYFVGETGVIHKILGQDMDRDEKIFLKMDVDPTRPERDPIMLIRGNPILNVIVKKI